MSRGKFDLEQRLIEFACTCLTICDLLAFTRPAPNLSFQLSKSATASALIYGEAQAAESKADFIHKLKLVLKEIRETRINLQIIIRKPVLQHPQIELALNECDQLMAIFMKSIETARKR